MLDLNTVQSDIEHWIETFVEVPHPALGGWAPCPYARKARIDRDFEVRLGNDPYRDAMNISVSGLNKSVVIYAYEAEAWSHMDFAYRLNQANQHWLLPHNLLGLEDHPDDQEIVNGISMNQGTYALLMIQNLSDLNEKAQLVAKKGFYHTWPEEYLQALFTHRKDPRAT
jgi:hypothetical protein